MRKLFTSVAASALSKVGANWASALLGPDVELGFYCRRCEAMGEIGEPDRVVRRERDPLKTPAPPTPVPELEPAQ